MKRFFSLLSVLVLAAACGKVGDGFQNKPVITGEDPYFSQLEYAPAKESSITVSALNGIDMVTVSLPSGNPDFITAGARKIIGIAANRNSGKLVLDMIDDASVAQAFVSGKVTAKAGTAIRGSKDPLELNITRLVTLLTSGEDLTNADAVVRFQVDVVDQSEYRTTETVSIRVTPGPSFQWENKNPEAPVSLANYARFKNVRVVAPGRIASILLKVDSPSADFVKWLKDRSAVNAAGYIDVLSGESSPLKLFTGSPAGQESCVLDFEEILYNLKIYADKGNKAATHELLLRVTDELGRESSLKMIFGGEVGQ